MYFNINRYIRDKNINNKNNNNILFLLLITSLLKVNLLKIN